MTDATRIRETSTSHDFGTPVELSDQGRSDIPRYTERPGPMKNSWSRKIASTRCFNSFRI